MFPRYESHYGLPLGRKKGKKEVDPEDDPLTKKKSGHVQRKLEERRKDNKAKLDNRVEEQFSTGRLLGKTSEHWWVWFMLCFQLVCLHDLARVDVVTGTSWRGRSWSSTRGSSNPRRPNKHSTPCISLCVLPYHVLWSVHRIGMTFFWLNCIYCIVRLYIIYTYT